MNEGEPIRLRPFGRSMSITEQNDSGLMKIRPTGSYGRRINPKITSMGMGWLLIPAVVIGGVMIHKKRKNK